MNEKEMLKRLDALVAEQAELRKTILLKYAKKSVEERIKTYEDACAEVMYTPAFSSQDTADEKAYKKLKVITKALNEGWTPDWNDESQSKYFPIFNMQDKPGFRFINYDYWSNHSACGSPLALKSSQLAIYAGEQFVEIYKDYFKPNNPK